MLLPAPQRHGAQAVAPPRKSHVATWPQCRRRPGRPGFCHRQRWTAVTIPMVRMVTACVLGEFANRRSALAGANPLHAKNFTDHFANWPSGRPLTAVSCFAWQGHPGRPAKARRCKAMPRDAKHCNETAPCCTPMPGLRLCLAPGRCNETAGPYREGTTQPAKGHRPPCRLAFCLERLTSAFASW
jgi:hypothetical protein